MWVDRCRSRQVPEVNPNVSWGRESWTFQGRSYCRLPRGQTRSAEPITATPRWSVEPGLPGRRIGAFTKSQPGCWTSVAEEQPSRSMPPFPQFRPSSSASGDHRRPM